MTTERLGVDLIGGLLPSGLAFDTIDALEVSEVVDIVVIAKWY